MWHYTVRLLKIIKSLVLKLWLSAHNIIANCVVLLEMRYFIGKHYVQKLTMDEMKS